MFLIWGGRRALSVFGSISELRLAESGAPDLGKSDIIARVALNAEKRDK